MDIYVDSPNLVSENLRFVLDQEGISENALAARTDGVGQKTIWNMIHRSGSQGPTVSTLELIARSLDLELWELLHPNLEGIWRYRVDLRRVMGDYLDANTSGKLEISQLVAEARKYPGERTV
jgi:transcriptional regulator with XRE-family HTH domain